MNIEEANMIEAILYEYYINQMTSMRTKSDSVTKQLEFLEKRDPMFRLGLNEYCGVR